MWLRCGTSRTSLLTTPQTWLLSAVIEAPVVRLVKYGMFDADCIRVSTCASAEAERFILRLDPQVADKLKCCFPEIQPVFY